jgi:lipoyl(octanoyl) transferase
MLVRNLGLRPYAEVWDLQRKLVYERAEDAAPDTLLLCEHEPVYTIGTSSRQPVPSGLPYPVHAVERGGDLTWHGPGQLVGYPIFSLRERDIMPRSFLRDIEEVLIEALLPLGIQAARIKGFTGLWVGGKKLVSIGIAVKDGVSYHGFALNVNCGLEAFRRIHPCKLEPEQMTSLQELLGRPLDEMQVAKLVAEAFLTYFPEPRLSAAS